MSRALLIAFAFVVPAVTWGNDFPTQARVEFVLGCMNERGGQSYDTLYPCVCLLDEIADAMSYAEFAEARVFAQLRSTAGERGGLFRDPEQAGTLTEKLEAALNDGEAACFVGGNGQARDRGQGGRNGEAGQSEAAREGGRARDGDEARGQAPGGTDASDARRQSSKLDEGQY